MGLPVVHFEMMSQDPSRVSDFYAKIFGWKVQNHPEVNYRVFETGNKVGIGGGILKPDRDAPWPGNQIWLWKPMKKTAKRKRK